MVILRERFATGVLLAGVVLPATFLFAVLLVSMVAAQLLVHVIASRDGLTPTAPHHSARLAFTATVMPRWCAHAPAAGVVLLATFLSVLDVYLDLALRLWDHRCRHVIVWMNGLDPTAMFPYARCLVRMVLVLVLETSTPLRCCFNMCVSVRAGGVGLIAPLPSVQLDVKAGLVLFPIHVIVLRSFKARCAPLAPVLGAASTVQLRLACLAV